MGDARVLRHDEAHAGFDEVAAGEMRRRPVEHVDDPALGAASPVVPGDAHGHAIAVEDLPHLARTQEKVVASAIERRETEAVAMGDDPPGQDRDFLDQAELALAVADDLPVANHGPQPESQRLGVALLLQAEMLRQRLEVERYAVALEILEDQRPARDRVFVARGFPRGVGIARAPVFSLGHKSVI